LGFWYEGGRKHRRKIKDNGKGGENEGMAGVVEELSLLTQKFTIPNRCILRSACFARKIYVYSMLQCKHSTTLYGA